MGDGPNVATADASTLPDTYVIAPSLVLCYRSKHYVNLVVNVMPPAKRTVADALAVLDASERAVAR